MTKFSGQNKSFYSIYDWGGQETMSALLLLAGLTEVRRPEDADILVFNGGADIGTEIYGELPAFRGIPQFKSNRDKEEIELYNEFVGKKFILGICRGAQLLNCLNGGTLWQHVDNHTRYHEMYDLRSGKSYHVSSTHHQMMRPNLKTGEVLAVADESRNKHAEHGHEHFLPSGYMKDGKDIEVVWYPNTKTLCVQGHPEYMPKSPFAQYVLDLMDECMKKEAAA